MTNLALHEQSRDLAYFKAEYLANQNSYENMTSTPSFSWAITYKEAPAEGYPLRKWFHRNEFNYVFIYRY